MRSVLFDIPLQGTVSLGPLGSVSVFGFGLVLAVWVILGALWGWLQFRRQPREEFDTSSLVVWLVIAGAIVLAPRKESLPIYGFGTMLFLAYVVSASVASWRLRRLGVAGETAWDVAIWIFLMGLIGGRTFFILQYHERFFIKGESPATTLFRLVNLPDGGLVLYGGLLFAPLAYWLFCRRKGFHPLPLADILITSVFFGLLFGRLGCLMHGCCFGDFCELPWAVTFPQGSAPYNVQVIRGYLAEDGGALRSLPLHPTQIYDAVNALSIALVTWAYYPFRRRDGEVVALAMLLYPINRFLVEFLRWDELGQFGTSLTISQWGSLVILAVAAAFLFWIEIQPAVRRPLTVAQTVMSAARAAVNATS